MIYPQAPLPFRAIALSPGCYLSARIESFTIVRCGSNSEETSIPYAIILSHWGGAREAGNA